MNRSKSIFSILSLVLGLFIMVSCGDTAEKAADATEDAVEAVSDAAGDAADAVKEAAGDATEAVGEVAGDAADAVKDAVDKSGPEYTSAYVCAMHCKGSGSDVAGKCPSCGMDYVANEHAGHSH